MSSRQLQKRSDLTWTQPETHMPKDHLTKSFRFKPVAFINNVINSCVLSATQTKIISSYASKSYIQKVKSYFHLLQQKTSTQEINKEDYTAQILVQLYYNVGMNRLKKTKNKTKNIPDLGPVLLWSELNICWVPFPYLNSVTPTLAVRRSRHMKLIISSLN